jgi:hypothetical protein
MLDLPPDAIGWLGTAGIAVFLIIIVVVAWRWHSKD